MITDRIGDLPAWTAIPAALFAPLVVWVLWRIQVLGVEVLRARLLVLLRHAKWLYNTVSWFGTFLHEMSHATVLLLSGHGIKQFSVRTDSGHVLPRRMRNGPVGFLFFLAAALAPLFGPPLLVLLALRWLVDPALFPWAAHGPGLGAALVALEAMLWEFPRRLVSAVAHLDLSDPWHAAALAAILLGIPGSRPSHVKGSRFHGEKDEGDVAVVRKKIRQNPWPLLVLALLLAAAHYPLTRWAPAVYWYPFQALWAVAVTAIVLALAGAVWWSLVAANAAVRPWLAWVPTAGLVALQVVGHGAGWSVVEVNAASLGAFLATTMALRLVAPRRSVRLGRLAL